MTSIADEIRARREAKSLTQMELAEQADVHHTTIAKIETGERLPSMKLADRLAEILGIPHETMMRLLLAGHKDKDTRIVTPISDFFADMERRMDRLDTALSESSTGSALGAHMDAMIDELEKLSAKMRDSDIMPAERAWLDGEIEAARKIVERRKKGDGSDLGVTKKGI